MASHAISAPQKQSAGKGMNITLWIIQGLLAVLYLFAGGAKFAMPIAQMTKGTGLSGGFLHFIGVCEVLGGLGLILPGIFRIRTGLTSMAAFGLVIIMIGATWISIAGMGVKAGLFPGAAGLLAAFVGYGRWKLAPLAARS